MISNRVEHVYVRKLAELCRQSSYMDTSANLLLCRQLHDKRYSYKTIYFTLVQYRDWLVNQRHMYDDVIDVTGNRSINLKNNSYDKDQEKLRTLLIKEEQLSLYKITPEEFVSDWEEENL